MSLASALSIAWQEAASTFTNGYALFKIEAHLACMIILVVLFNHQQNSSDQTKVRVVWSRMLIAQFLWSISAIVRVLVDINIIPKTEIAIFIVTWVNITLFTASFVLAIVYFKLYREAQQIKADKFAHISITLIIFYGILFAIGVAIQFLNWKNPLMAYMLLILDIWLYIGYADSLVSIDPLTKISNRNGLYRTLTKTFNGEYSSLDNLYLFAVDIENLWGINSRYGRAEGDQILIMVANALKKFRDEEHKCYIARYYGDVFMIIAEVPSNDERDLFIEHIRNYVSNAAMNRGLSYHIRVNIGWAKYEQFSKTETMAGLIEEANNALNYEKEQRNS